jgi:hypothetical protein
MKNNRTFTFKFNQNDFRACFTPRIQLNKPCEIALHSIDLYNVFPNVTENNNIFRYSEIKQGEKEWKEIELPINHYDSEDLIEYISEKVLKRKTSPLEISFNQTTLRFEIVLSNQVTVDFTHERSMHKIFGFEKVELEEKKNYSTIIPDFDPVKNIFVECSLVDKNSNYLNGTKSNVLFNFPVSNDIGEKIHAEPYNILYVPTVSNEISDIGIRLTDPDGKLIDLKNTLVVIKLHLRES